MNSQASWFAFINRIEKQKRPKITRALLRRVWQFAQPYQIRTAILLLTILLVTAIYLVSPLLFRDLIDNALPNRDIARLNWLALGMVTIPILRGVISVWQRFLGTQIGEGIIYDLRCALYAHLQRMSFRFFTQTQTGELMSRLNNDVIGAQQAITSTLVTIISNMVSLVATLAIMIALEWRLTLLGLAILPLFMLPARYVGGTLRDMRRRTMEINAEMNATMNETLNVRGALLVKLFGREKQGLGQFSNDAAAVRDIGVQSAVVGQWFVMMLGLVGAVGTAVVFWVGGHLVLRGEFTIGTIVAFGTYLTQLYGPLASLTNAPVEFAQSMVSFERVFELLDIPIEIEERPKAIRLPQVKGRIQFAQVSFNYATLAEGKQGGLHEVRRYAWNEREVLLRRGKQRDGNLQANDKPTMAQKPAQPWALRNINFTIEPGQLAALVGPSGAGKTTLTYLIPRLYDPTEGRILIDGHDTKDVTLQSLSNNIGMVTQETYLYFDTIRANLLYAKPNATEAEMLTAAKVANIHEFIIGLPDGYDTVVGEQGYRLSGGERQRLAIARVILKDPRILILDEATSHLDALSEKLIQEALQCVMHGRTNMVIAHRLSTIRSADLILVIDQGHLVEQGTHQELLAKNGLYTALYETQFQPPAVTANQ